MDIRQLMMRSLKRDPGQLRESPEGHIVALGESGNDKTMDATCLGLPDWCWPRDRIPFGDNTVGIVHAYHFMEHLTGEEAINMLKEIQRVLVPGGIFQ